MGRNRHCMLKYGAAICLSSFLACLCTFDNYWSFCSVCNLCTSPYQIRQWEFGPRISSNQGNSVSKEREHNPGMNNMNDEEKIRLNVTGIVLRELQGGFFATITENRNNASGLDTVCLSEPTILECESEGFAALLLATLDHLSYCDMLGIHHVSIKWKNCGSSCITDPRLNSWPAYFEPLNTEIEMNASKFLCLGGIIAGTVLRNELARTLQHLNPQQIKHTNWAIRSSSLLEVGFRKRQSLAGYEEGSLITPKLRKWVNEMIRKYIRPQKSIKLRAEEFYRKNMEVFNVLGVHVRGTDHWVEMEEKALPEIEQWINDTQAIFETLQEPKKIFLASDNHESIHRFVEHFGKNKVVFTAANRAEGYLSNEPVHCVVTEDPIELGSQVLIDILLLAKCGHFLSGESSVASLASFFNPEMKLFFVGHLEDYAMYDESNEIPLPDPSTEITEVEWEEDWDGQLATLTRCFKKNSLYSACPSMARGQLVEARDVRKILFQKN